MSTQGSGGRRLGVRTQRIQIIDYYSVPWEDVPAGTPPAVAIVARDWFTGDERCWAWHLAAERQRIPAVQIRDRQEELERSTLEAFAQYVASRPKARWLHWGLRGVRWGIPALRQRMAVHGLEPLRMADNRVFDLADHFKRQWGEEYVTSRRLNGLANLNHISTHSWLNLDGLTAAFREGRFADMLDSLRRKVSCIARVFELYMGGSLRTESSDRPSQQLAWAARRGRRTWFQCFRETVTADQVGAIGESSAGTSDPNLTPPAAPERDCPAVVLNGPGKEPVVRGARKSPLTKPQYDVVLALLEAGDEGLSKDELLIKSRRGDPLGILRRLRENDKDWKAVIRFPGKTGGRYRIG